MIRCSIVPLIVAHSAIEFYTQKKVTSDVFMLYIFLIAYHSNDRRRQAFGSRQMLSLAGHLSICRPITNLFVQRPYGRCSSCVQYPCLQMLSPRHTNFTRLMHRIVAILTFLITKVLECVSAPLVIASQHWPVIIRFSIVPRMIYKHFLRLTRAA